MSVQGSFSEGVTRDHEGHLQMGSFSDTTCAACREIVAKHEQHVQGSFSEGVDRDAEGHLRTGSFADSDCPICRQEAAATH